MKYVRHSLMAALAFSGLSLGASGALAMPNGLPSVSAAAPSNVENVRWVCGPYRCWWRPGPYWRPAWGGYWAPRRYWGWGGGWHRWGWHRGWW